MNKVKERHKYHVILVFKDRHGVTTRNIKAFDARRLIPENGLSFTGLTIIGRKWRAIK